MNNLASVQKYLLKKIITVFPEVKLSLADISSPPAGKMGDFTFACFRVALKKKESPAKVAQFLASQIIPDEIIASMEAVGPYLNFFLKKDLLNKLIIKESLNSRFKAKKEKIMIEYSSPNTHKEFHVGHIRNICLGGSLAKILAKVGYSVTPVNYINDTGAPVAKCLWGYLHLGDKKQEEVSSSKGAYLAQLYVKANKIIEEDAKAKAEAEIILQKLENKDPEIFSIWQKTREWSLDQFNRIYQEFGINFVDTFFDSNILDEGKKMVDELLEKGIAKKDQGAIIVDLKEYGLDVMILIKSSGAALYQTKDLALARKKFAKFDVDESIYVVDVRQSFYFKQIFKILELYGFKKKLIHVPYEFVTTSSGAMASRKGNVILYEDLIAEINEAVIKETTARHPDWSSEDIKNISFKVALAAIKFYMLKYDPSQVVVFDSQKALSFEGDTGPYVLYTGARIQSILRQNGKKIKKNVDYSLLKEAEEIELLNLLKQFPDVCLEAAKYYKPSLIATFLLNLSRSFNHFYHNVSVLKIDNNALKEARLALISAVLAVLSQGMDLLNIEIVDRM